MGEVSKISCRDDSVRGLKQNDHSILQQLYAKAQQVMDNGVVMVGGTYKVY